MTSAVSGARNGPNATTGQTATHAQPPADLAGTAAGMLRTLM